jgi:uncharacterized YccA/Bax inhibitor family protein
MLRSSNPILSKKDAFTPAAPNAGYAGYPGQNPYQQNPYGQPQGYAPYGGVQTEGRMTLDDVITKTAAVLGLLVISAALSWWFIPDSLYMPALILSALVGFGTVLLVSFRRSVSPPLVFVYAVIEGVFIGMISKLFEMYYPGIVIQAVLGTFIAAGATLAAYKFFNIKVTPKFRRVVIISTFAFAGAMLVNLLLSLFGINLGIRDGGTGPISLIAIGFSLLGVVLAVLNLVLDFDYIEQGVAIGAPASESWRGAFGLTVTMVWLYVEILRILSYLRR